MRLAVAVSIIVLAVVSPPSMDRSSTAKAEDGLKVGTLRVAKILFLGNSITLHGPAPEIGWTGNWGMAASALEKDYVHQLVSRISKSAGGTPKVMARNIADFERKLTDFDIGEILKEELAFEADVVIVAIGENAASPKTEDARKRFADAVSDLLSQLGKRGHPKLFVRSQFWPDAEKDRLLKQASENAGAVFVDMGKLGGDPANCARSERRIENAAVAGHPGDRGMAAIAEQLWRALEREGLVD